MTRRKKTSWPVSTERPSSGERLTLAHAENAMESTSSSPPSDPDSRTYKMKIPILCGKCHREGAPVARIYNIPERDILSNYSQSIHGEGLFKQGLIVTATCNDCHGNHRILGHDEEESTITPKNLPATCGSCHEDLSESYKETIHGKAYALGYLKAAKCSDCHGAHNIRKVDDPQSHVGFNRVVETCRNCHPDANRRFTGYLTHATHHDKRKYPALYFTFWSMTSLLILVFGFFGLHNLLWMPRSFKHLKEKRKAAKIHKRYYIQRFNTGERITHIFVILSFMGLALTGMMFKFAGMPWAKALAGIFGGVEAAGRIHRISAVITFGYFFAHLASLVRSKIRTKTPWKQVIMGKRSLWFNRKDWRDFVGSVKWFLGLGPRPEYGRWTYWEKFDYMAVFRGVGVIGLSGLILWFPELFTKFLPGWLINVAMIIHSDEALLAVGFIFTIHFFNTHLRPESFPLDPVIFTGSVPLDEYKEDRPEEYRYLKESGKLKKAVEFKEVSPKMMLAVRIFGFTFLLLGLSLVVLIIYSMLFGYK